MNYKNFINNEWLDADSGKTFEVFNPYTEKVIAKVPASGKSDVDKAVEAAQTAFRDWGPMTAGDRRDFLQTLAQRSLDHADSLAKTISSEMGKPIKDAMTEIEDLSEYLQYYSELARDQVGRIVSPVQKKSMSLVRYEPYGVVGCIIPWNYPLSLMGWKLAPALAAGNTIIMKPSEVTSLSLLHWAEVVSDIMPSGVLNVITGYGFEAGEEIVKHPSVPIITFTGSVKTGKRIAMLAAENLKKVSLELGGHAPFIIFDDASLDDAVDGALIAKYRNSGQTCVCANRIYVQSSIYDDFTKCFTEKASQLVVGDGLLESTQQGPLINKDAMKKASKHIEHGSQNPSKK